MPQRHTEVKEFAELRQMLAFVIAQQQSMIELLRRQQLPRAARRVATKARSITHSPERHMESVE
jgi:hypothetical protein